MKGLCLLVGVALFVGECAQSAIADDNPVVKAATALPTTIMKETLGKLLKI